MKKRFANRLMPFLRCIRKSNVLASPDFSGGARQAVSVSQIGRLRSQIKDNFVSLESLTDATRFEFEFRHRREKDIAECGRIQGAQPALRSIYLLELSLLSDRGRWENDSELRLHVVRDLGLDCWETAYEIENMLGQSMPQHYESLVYDTRCLNTQTPGLV